MVAGGVSREKKMRFEDMEVWKLSARLATDIFVMTKDLSCYGFLGQIMRSALSVPSNIAEGAERNSSKELVHFLGIAKGSCGELRTQLYIGMEAGFLDRKITKEHIETTKRISAMLYSLIQTIKKKM